MTGRRILFLGYFTGFAGGIERYAFQTALLLRKAGAEVDWCGEVPARGEDSFRSGFDRVLSAPRPADLSSGYDLVAMHKLPSLPVLKQWRERFGERLVFWAHDHDLYCPRRHYYIPFGRINCHRAYSPCRCAICARLSAPHNWKYLRAGQSALLRELKCRHAVVLSSFMRDNLLRNGFEPSRIHRIPPVIEPGPGPVRSGSSGPLKILFLGQLIRGKGADLLLEALRDLAVPWQARIAGDGPDRPMLERMVREWGMEPKIEFTSWLAEPKAELAACDVLVFPSRWQEPFGLSGAEAAGCGKPVAAFDVGGVREWLDDGINGFLVPEKDTAALTAKLELLARDPALRMRLGAAGYRLVGERFTPQLFLDHFQQLIEKVSS